MNQQKIQEMQMLEQTLQNLLFQRQSFEMEISETKSALQEIENSGEDVFKIVGQLMIKSDKQKVKEELQEKEKMLDSRLKIIEKQEKTLSERLEKTREEFLSSENKNKS